VALGKVNKIKFVIVMSGANFGGSKYGMPKLASNAYSKLIDCPSLHKSLIILSFKKKKNSLHLTLKVIVASSIVIIIIFWWSFHCYYSSIELKLKYLLNP